MACLRVVYEFVQHIEVVVVDASEIQTMNCSGENLPPRQIQNLGHICPYGFVHSYC